LVLSDRSAKCGQFKRKRLDAASGCKKQNTMSVEASKKSGEFRTSAKEYEEDGGRRTRGRRKDRRTSRTTGAARPAFSRCRLLLVVAIVDERPGLMRADMLKAKDTHAHPQPTTLPRTSRQRFSYNILMRGNKVRESNGYAPTLCNYLSIVCAASPKEN